MGETFRHLYEQVVSFENLWQAYQKTRRGKRYQEPAACFDMDAEENVLQLQKELAEKTQRPGAYRHFHVSAPRKRRFIPGFHEVFTALDRRGSAS